MKLTGLAEATKKMDDLDRKVQKSIVRKGLRKGAKVLLAALRADTPESSGNLKSKIKIRSGKSGKGKTTINIGGSRKDFHAFKGSTFYLGFLLFGFHTGGRKKAPSGHMTAVPANNFFERAFDSTSVSAVQTTVDAWKDLIEEETN